MTGTRFLTRLLVLGSVLTLVSTLGAAQSPPPLPTVSLPPAFFHEPASASAPGDRPDYGTTNLTYVEVAGAAFAPVTSGTAYGISNVNTGQVLLTSGGAFV